MSLQGLSDDLAAIASPLKQSTVLIQGAAGAVGSGVVWDASGLVVTNAHVVPQRRVWVTLSDGQQLPAHRVGYRQRLDLAALKVEATGLRAAPAGDAGALRVGQVALAVGDRILGINGRLFRHPGDLMDWLDCLIRDQPLVVHVSQGSESLVCTLTVGRPPIQEQTA